MQSMVYDGQSQEEMAEHFKKLGNDAFRMVPQTAVANQNALACYTRALEMESKDKAVNSQLYCNRAAVSLRVKEYEKAVNDCRQALKIDADNHKASYRAAKASEAQGLTAKALMFCTDALRNSEDKEIRMMKIRLTDRLKSEESGRQDDRKVLVKAAEELRFADLTATNALQERAVHLGPPMWDLTHYTRSVPPRPRLARTGEEEQGDGKAVIWPLLMLYDESSQTDFVESFDDRCALEDQLQLMFPADRHVDWDEEGKYTWDRLVCYLECYQAEEGKDTRNMRVKTDECLQDQLHGHRVPPCLVFHVFVADTPAHAHFCSNHSLPS